MKSVCIVDDQQISLDAVEQILNESGNMQIIGAFSSAEKLLKEFDSLQPDITIVDLDLPGVGGIEVITLLKSSYPNTKFLVLTNYSDDDKLFNALRAGADGYLLKKDAYKNLESALISVSEGGAPMTAEVARKVILHFQKQVSINDFTNLTEKEKIVLQLLVDGFLYKEIAAQMSVTIDAIKKHTQSIYDKLHVRTRSEAIKKFLTNS
ncbi:response regulator [Ferruginibacter sp. SUN106]|uniref:response regulator n=1 Tax=Ferruginibacter sp. SUN106 TaxID=2978348 RepID=UPI003D36782F